MALTTLLSAVVALQAPSTPVTADLVLLATSPTPDVAKIRPYRSALVAQEYQVKTIVSGKNPDVKAGSKIRLFRWGLMDGKPTKVGKAKKGDKVRLTFKPLAGWTQMEREFQVDTLESDLAITYFVEVGKPK
ncbi:MAG: hypothetical protein ACO1SV_06440 [Fimbriimonas sp.]